MSSSLVGRLLVKSGVVSYLRGQWREDDAALRAKIERHTAKAVAALHATIRDVRADANAASYRLEQLTADLHGVREAAVGSDLLDRLQKLEHQLRLVRTTIELNAHYRSQTGLTGFESQATAAHVSSAIRSAVMHEDPTAHLVVTGVLPDNVYGAIL
jgi:hypothetical protein